MATPSPDKNNADAPPRAGSPTTSTPRSGDVSSADDARPDSASQHTGRATWFIRTAATPKAVSDALRSASRRGALPGFTPSKDASAQQSHRGADASSAPGQPLFSVTDYGTPFESQLVGRAQHHKGEAGITLTSTIKPTMPIVTAVVMLLSVYPGVYLSDMFMREFFSGTLAAKWVWWWHIGLSAPFLPLAFRSAMRKSAATGREAAAAHVDAIRSLLGAAESGSAPADRAREQRSPAER